MGEPPEKAASVGQPGAEESKERTGGERGMATENVTEPVCPANSTHASTPLYGQTKSIILTQLSSNWVSASCHLVVQLSQLHFPFPIRCKFHLSKLWKGSRWKEIAPSGVCTARLPFLMSNRRTRASMSKSRMHLQQAGLKLHFWDDWTGGRYPSCQQSSCDCPLNCRQLFLNSPVCTGS